MPLVDIELPADISPLPRPVLAFLREADRRIEEFQSTSRAPAFVPSDFPGAYHVLRTIMDGNVAPGTRFCEWGSGFGIVASLAAMLEFEAYGIEIETDLVSAARDLADDFEIPVVFVCDSFIPHGGEPHTDVPTSFGWLTTEAGRAEDELDLATDDFDVIFAYPWPDEESVIDDLFEQYAASGAVLVTYNGLEGFQVRRKTEPRRSRSASRGNKPGQQSRGPRK